LTRISVRTPTRISAPDRDALNLLRQFDNQLVTTAGRKLCEVKTSQLFSGGY